MRQKVTPPAGERVTAYIDGFNLYQGIRDKGWAGVLWTDLRCLSEQFVLGGQVLGAVKYFTAHRRAPPESYTRQQIYFAALDARGGVERIEGRFDKVSAPCQHCGRITRMPRERETDINLAAHLVRDAARAEFDVALLISGDGDFVGAIRAVQSLGRAVKVVRPPGRRGSEIATAADYVKDLGKRHLVRSQMPDPVAGSSDTSIRCPFPWLSIQEKIARLNDGHRLYVERILQETDSSHREHIASLVDELWATER